MGVVYSLYDHSRKESYRLGKRIAEVFRTDEWADYGGVDWSGYPHKCRPARRYETVEALTTAILLDEWSGGPVVEENLRRIARGAFAFMQGREKVCMHDDCSYDEPDGYREIDGS